MDNEIWRTIPYYGNYAVSSLGKVKRIAGGRGAIIGRIIRPYITTNGYLAVCLCENNRNYPCRVHQLILSAFVGPQPFGYEAHHKNDNKLDTRLGNLEYMPTCEHKAMNTGERNPNAKLTNESVLEIRKLKEQGWTSQKIAERFDIKSSSVIRSICRRESWTHV